MKSRILALTLGCAVVAFGDYAHTVECSSPGVYEITESGTDVTLSGPINGNVDVKLPANCRVSLSGITMSGVLTINGDAELMLVGANSVTTDGATAISCSGTLTIAGTGSLAATSSGAKKTGVISAENLTLAGGTTTLTISNPKAKNACGVSLSGDYAQTDGTLKIVGSSDMYKQNGVFLAKKNTKATITGGTLDVTLAGEKSVGLAMDKDTVTGTMSGGTLKFAMSGDGAKGVKGDGSFTMTGGTLEATLSGGVVEDYFEYEDGDGNTWNYYVTLSSSTKTSGGTSVYNTTSLVANGTYPVMDPSKCYAVKVGTLDISGGAITVSATGTAGRGLGADNMTISGGTFDISVAGGTTDVYVESLLESDELTDDTFASGVPTCLDSGGASCLKTSGTNSVLTISGGTFNLGATGNAGKLINAAGYLVIGTEGQTTLPSDSSFSPDISGSATGSKVFCTAVKQKYYGTLAVATATTNISDKTLSVANDNLVSVASTTTQTTQSFGAPGGQGDPNGGMPPSGGMPGGGTPPDGGTTPGGGMPGGMDDDADYSNPKGIKAYSGVTVHGGRIVVTTANDGGEGFESKNDFVINGGVIDLQCYDDSINSGSDLYINGGYVYAASSGNDAIDSNGNIYMTGGVVLAFSTAGGAEVGIDTDNASGLVISGGHLVAVGGAAGNMVIGSSGMQKTYMEASASASTYSGKYLSMTGTETFTVKMPTLSGTFSLVCTTEGWTSAGTPEVSTTAPATGSLSFHDTYITSGGTSTGSNSTSPAHELFNSDTTPITATSKHVYSGYFMANGEIAGTILLKVGRANSRTGIAKFTATVQLLGGKKTVYTASTEINSSSPTTVTLTSSSKDSASTLTLTVGGSYMAGTIDGFTVEGARNQSAAKETRATEYAAKSGSTINIVFTASDAKGSGAEFANGYSALALKILTKGKAKLTGTMADGTRVFVSGLQMLLNEDGTEACIPVSVPLYTGKLGGFAFLLWIGNDGSLDVTNLSGWDATPSAAAPFSATMSLVDAAALTAPVDGTLAFSVDTEAFPSTINDLPVLSDLLPQEVAVSAQSGRLTAANDNVAKLKISRVKSTGIFNGSFAAYTQNGDRTRKKTVPFKGVFVNGVGYGSAIVKGAGSAAVMLK